MATVSCMKEKGVGGSSAPCTSHASKLMELLSRRGGVPDGHKIQAQYTWTENDMEAILYVCNLP